MPTSYPYDPKNYLTDKLDAGMRRVYELIWKLRIIAWVVLWTGSGWRYNSVEHATGSAVDAMMSSAVGKKPTAEQKACGYRLLKWLIKNHVALRLQGVIWDGHVYGYSDPTWSARPLTWKPDDVGNQHEDHLHIKGKDNLADVPAGFDPGMDIDVDVPDNGNAPVVIDPWDGKSLPDLDIFCAGFEHPGNLLLQKRLKAHGYDPGQLDGIFGPKTMAAVKRFQADQGWDGPDADGIPGPVTWELLMEAPETKSAPRLVSRISIKNLRRARTIDMPKSGTPLGAYANEVFTLETILYKAGYLKNKARIDGHYGTDTDAAVDAMQRETNPTAKPDGWVGPREALWLIRKAKMTGSVKVID